jgi:hypothetical protein
MARARTYTDERFVEVVKNNFSVRECLKQLGVRPTGGNYKCFHIKVSELKLDTSHFTGQGHLKGKSHTWTQKIPLVDILKEGTDYQSHKLRLRLIKEGIKEHKCEMCNNTEWLGKPIALELEHTNGIHTDNRIENLKLLCPNCHSTTTTYRGKNKGKSK